MVGSSNSSIVCMCDPTNSVDRLAHPITPSIVPSHHGWTQPWAAAAPGPQLFSKGASAASPPLPPSRRHPPPPPPPPPPPAAAAGTAAAAAAAVVVVGGARRRPSWFSMQGVRCDRDVRICVSAMEVLEGRPGLLLLAPVGRVDPPPPAESVVVDGMMNWSGIQMGRGGHTQGIQNTGRQQTRRNALLGPYGDRSLERGACPSPIRSRSTGLFVPLEPPEFDRRRLHRGDRSN